jgi:hypothetical protein
MKLTIKEMLNFWWNGVIKDKKIWLLGVVLTVLTLLNFYLVYHIIRKISLEQPFWIEAILEIFLLLLHTFWVSVFYSTLAYGVIHHRDQFISYYKQLKFMDFWQRIAPASGVVVAFLVSGAIWGGIVLLGMALGGVDFNTEGIHIANPIIFAIFGGLALIYLAIYLYVLYGKSGEALSSDSFKKAFFTQLSAFYDVKYLKRSLNAHYIVNTLVVFALFILIGLLIGIISGGIRFILLLTISNPLVVLFAGMAVEVIAQTFGNLILTSLGTIGASFAHLSTLEGEGDSFSN